MTRSRVFFEGVESFFEILESFFRELRVFLRKLRVFFEEVESFFEKVESFFNLVECDRFYPLNNGNMPKNLLFMAYLPLFLGDSGPFLFSSFFSS